MTRHPRTYLGLKHETLGSDILAVIKAVTLPERTLGAELATRLSKVDAKAWYPISWLLEGLEALDAKLGSFGLKHVGWELFKLSHADAFRQVAKSARDLVYGLDAMYHHANRGQGIGGWKVLRFEPGLAEVEKTTPHHCGMEEGILEEAMRTLGIKVEVSQRECFRKGADACVFVLKSPITDARWTG